MHKNLGNFFLLASKYRDTSNQISEFFFSFPLIMPMHFCYFPTSHYCSDSYVRWWHQAIHIIMVDHSFTFFVLKLMICAQIAHTYIHTYIKGYVWEIKKSQGQADRQAWSRPWIESSITGAALPLLPEQWRATFLLSASIDDDDDDDDDQILWRRPANSSEE